MKKGEKEKACLYMINHYLTAAKECRNQFNDLVDFYTVYDYNMMMVEKYRANYWSRYK